LLRTLKYCLTKIRSSTRYRTTHAKLGRGQGLRSICCTLKECRTLTNKRELVTCLSTALAMVEASCLEARMQREM
jgi:hypothetical protein